MPEKLNDSWQSLSEHLDVALDLAETERARWLEALEKADPDMAALVSLALAAREREGFTGFLQGSLPQALEGMNETTLVGRQIGPYIIDAEIGRGGMGSVWRAHRVDGLYEGTVAIKFVHAAWIGRAGEQRFRVEGNLLGRLDHPNIARLIDAGVLLGTQPYLILEYIEGEPIDMYCDRQKLGLEARVNLFLDVLAAVAHAHSHLIVHRDIKPSNVFVTHGGVVKLLDFGIAKLLQEDPGSAPLTQSNATPLTPQFAAPEQLLGKPVTTVTDIYSLGLLLYVLLTGKHAITADSRSSADLMRAVLTEEPARASTAATIPAIRRRALEGDLDNILRKALRKESLERYPSAGAFADDLKRFLTHEPVQARPDTVAYRVTKFVRRNQGGVLSALLVTIALLGTTAFALWELHEARADRDIAVSETRRAHGHDLMMGYLFDDSVRNSPEDAVHKRLDRAREFIEQRYGGDPDIAASLFLSLRHIYLQIGDAKSALSARASAEAIARHYNDPYINADIACLAAQDSALAGNLAEAREQLHSALANMRLLRVVSPELSINCAQTQAVVAQADGDYTGAIANLHIVVNSIEEHGDHESSAWVSASSSLATTLGMSSDFREAYEVNKCILGVLKASGFKDTSTYYAVASLGCAVLRAGGQPRGSVAFIDSVVAEARAGGADIDVPYYIDACRDLSRVSAGEVGEVEASLMRNAKSVASSGMQHMSIHFQVALLAVAMNRGDLASADERWTALAPIEQQMLSAKQAGYETLAILMIHARLDTLHGHMTDALQRLDQMDALVAARHQANANSRSFAVLRAEALMANHDYSAAARNAQEALELARKTAIDPQSSAWIGEALLWRARAEVAMGDQAKAKATAGEALPHLEKNMDPASSVIAAARALAAT